MSGLWFSLQLAWTWIIHAPIWAVLAKTWFIFMPRQDLDSFAPGKSVGLI